MSRLHGWYCRTRHWQRLAAGSLFDRTLGDRDTGSDVLDLGSGTGAATQRLCAGGRRVTALDRDVAALGRLRRRVDGVIAVAADATRLPFADRQFSAVTAFSMVHHVAGLRRQRRLFREAFRVIRPGGLFAGCDPVAGWLAAFFHLGDAFAPIPPARLEAELRAAGFDDVWICINRHDLTWRARRPGLSLVQNSHGRPADRPAH